ncbi:CheY-like chemotaxis protein [Methylobacterium sp. BE186]|uniref:response regulator n=1 Tax=Methylobacterium sp. BE186 TaxID=2817715 RepID=UPI0028563755|nr:response regulator [Methylobacterium sp. BE186]MDR7039313.1 CheY-like chemotaxis protein [Methylobacterium sp. BE186]
MRTITHSPPLALVVETVPAERERAVALIEETALDVMACASGEAAIEVLQRCGHDVALMVTRASLDCERDGIRLARAVGKLWPRIRLVVTAGEPEAGAADLPGAATCLRRPWLPLDLLVEAHRAVDRAAPVV